MFRNAYSEEAQRAEDERRALLRPGSRLRGGHVDTRPASRLRVEGDGSSQSAIANTSANQGGYNPEGLPDYERAANDGVISPTDYRLRGTGGGAGAGSGIAGAAGAGDLAPWQPGSAGGAPGIPAAVQSAAPTAAAGFAAGPWGAVAMQAADLLAKAGEERRAKRAAQDDMSAQFAGDISDFPQYEYQGRKKRDQIRDKFGGPGLGNLFGLLG